MIPFHSEHDCIHWTSKGRPYVMAHVGEGELLNAQRYMGITAANRHINGVPEQVLCLFIPIPTEYMEVGMEPHQIKLHVFGALTLAADAVKELQVARLEQRDITTPLFMAATKLGRLLCPDAAEAVFFVDTMMEGFAVKRTQAPEVEEPPTEGPQEGDALAVRWLVYSTLERRGVDGKRG